MMKLQTPVDIETGKVRIGIRDKIMVLGSCFADNVGLKMQEAGMDVCVNPFGTLYNPASIADTIRRMISGQPFTKDECRMMGSGAGMVCSFSHHTSFARKTEEEFLENANAALSQACGFFRNCDKMIVTLGTVWCYRHIEDDRIVSNCLKRDAREFERVKLSMARTARMLKEIAGDGSRQIIFTVSPIRHMRDGAHENQLSKATLLLAADDVCRENSFCSYFPAYEIVMDELRDYRFYAEDMLHPSQQTVDYIWERFCESTMSASDLSELREAERLYRRSLHRPILMR